jgi:glycosyltransferase involved in cell wall biosynthesis
MATPDVSVILPTHNRKDILEKCLAHYERQTFPADRFEVIVVDDGSTDDTWGYLQQASGRKKYGLVCLRKGNGGPGSARNMGFSRARGKVLLVIGDDIFPDAGLVAEHWAWHAERHAEENVGILGFVTWADEASPSPLMKWLETGYQNAYNLIRHGEQVDWRFSYTGNISLKRRFLEEANEYFDERFPPYGYEDIEWGYRLMRKNFALRYNRNAIGFHHHHVTLEDSLRRMEKVGKSARTLRTINPELFAMIMDRNIPAGRSMRLLLSLALRPSVVRGLVLPMARFLEHRAVSSGIYSLAHLYYFRRGLDMPEILGSPPSAEW